MRVYSEEDPQGGDSGRTCPVWSCWESRPGASMVLRAASQILSEMLSRRWSLTFLNCVVGGRGIMATNWANRRSCWIQREISSPWGELSSEWVRLPKEAAVLEVFNMHWDKALSNQVWTQIWPCSEQELKNSLPIQIFCSSMILWKSCFLIRTMQIL